jgi:hypothetical protein
MTNTYAAYITNGKYTDVFMEFAKKYGTPPNILSNPMVVEVNKVDLESIKEVKLPNGMKMVVSAERFILPKHIFIKLEDKVEDGEH